MFSRSKFYRLTRHEYLPELILIINILILIHVCNTYYEYTGNQYILTDDDDDHSKEFCPLYPSTLQGKINDDRISNYFLFK
jgi:hypothetical protein